MKKIFIVEGQTGEYEDRRKWIVATYFSEEEAKLHVEKATQRAKELKVHDDCIDDNYYEWRAETWDQKYGTKQIDMKKWNKYDLSIDIDYNGVNYYYYSVDLFNSVSSFLKNVPKEIEKIKSKKPVEI